MREPIVVVPYDPAGPDVFNRIRKTVASALGDIALDIVHVGSTAVPGLAAKPIIDVDVVISTEAELGAVIGKLSTIGYKYEGDLGIKGRHAFVQPANLPSHHLYVCEVGSPELKRHVVFRDYLRKNPKAAKAYAELKHQLAQQFGASRDRYASAKTAFVEDVLSRLRPNDNIDP